MIAHQLTLFWIFGDQGFNFLGEGRIGLFKYLYFLLLFFIFIFQLFIVRRKLRVVRPQFSALILKACSSFLVPFCLLFHKLLFHVMKCPLLLKSWSVWSKLILCLLHLIFSYLFVFTFQFLKLNCKFFMIIVKLSVLFVELIMLWFVLQSSCLMAVFHCRDLGVFLL